MTKEKMQHYLDTVPGVGVETKWSDGITVCHFYEDFFGDPGITRAMRQVYHRMGLGQITEATFIVRALSEQHLMNHPKRKKGASKNVKHNLRP